MTKSIRSVTFSLYDVSQHLRLAIVYCVYCEYCLHYFFLVFLPFTVNKIM